jgi:hypothetical protein
MNPNRSAPVALACCLLALVAASPALARELPPPPGVEIDVEWLSVVLAGRKVGHARIERETTPARVTTRQLMKFEMGRSGVAVTMSTFESHEETPLGEPVAFTSVSSISGLKMRVEGRRIEGDRFAVKSGAVGALRESELAWPEGALLSWGMEQRLRAAGTRPGTTLELSVFQPLLQDAVPLIHEVIGPAVVDLPGGPAELIELRQAIRFPGGDMVSRVWADDELSMRRSTMDIMGQTLELNACDEACATAPNQPAEILETALLRAPRKLTAADLAGGLRIELRSETPLSGWPEVDGQRLVDLGDGRYRIELPGAGAPAAGPDPDGAAAPPASAALPAPGPRDLARTDWLDYDSPAVAALLEGIDLDLAPASRMAALQERVYRHISTKNLRIGYASAGDAARLREGDCTEHALLLAALGRAAGVPTRVANGLAYTEDFGSGGPVFVPHAWVAAWTGERWQAFDAALPGDQLRLAVHADNGDPWRFYSGLDAMASLDVESITADP